MTSWITALARSSQDAVLSFLGISGSLDQYKIVILICLYMTAFFSFTQSMRYLSWSIVRRNVIGPESDRILFLSDHFEFLVTPTLTESDIAYLRQGEINEAKMEKNVAMVRTLASNPVSGARILNWGGSWCVGETSGCVVY
jgi:hypothetical protein